MSEWSRFQKKRRRERRLPPDTPRPISVRITCKLCGTVFEHPAKRILEAIDCVNCKQTILPVVPYSAKQDPIDGFRNRRALADYAKGIAPRYFPGRWDQKKNVSEQWLQSPEISGP